MTKTTTYRNTRTGEIIRITADWSQASSPIRVDGQSTPLQVADARHRPANGLRLVLAWLRSQGA